MPSSGKSSELLISSMPKGEPPAARGAPAAPPARPAAVAGRRGPGGPGVFPGDEPGADGEGLGGAAAFRGESPFAVSPRPTLVSLSSVVTGSRAR